MTGNEYQNLAARTIGYMDKESQIAHALHGMSAEVGELHGLYQKKHQGHGFDKEHAKKEVGDILWMIAEYCTANNWKLEDIMEMNIEKIMARYPNGFEAERSLHRKDVDV